jgi:hypothetical protein
MDENDKTEDINFEEVARFGIYEAYIQTDYYLGFRVACENIFETRNKEIQRARQLGKKDRGKDFLITKDRCDTELHKAILYLNDRTGIPHDYRLDDKNPEYHVTEPELHFDYLPFTIRQVTPEPPKMITLRFDIEKGIQHQLENAATIIKDELAKTKIQEGGGSFLKTTRKTFKTITDAINTVVQRNKMNREKKAPWDEVASALNLKLETARKRYKMGNNLILSGEIRKYFPEFR